MQIPAQRHSGIRSMYVAGAQQVSKLARFMRPLRIALLVSCFFSFSFLRANNAKQEAVEDLGFHASGYDASSFHAPQLFTLAPLRFEHD